MQSVNEKWFHGELGREEAQQRLRDDGDFLVRTSPLKPGEYVVSARWNSETLHFICLKAPEASWYPAQGQAKNN